MNSLSHLIPCCHAGALSRPPAAGPSSGGPPITGPQGAPTFTPPDAHIYIYIYLYTRAHTRTPGCIPALFIHTTHLCPEEEKGILI